MRPFLAALIALSFLARTASAEEPVPAVATTSGGAAVSSTPAPTPAPPPLPAVELPAPAVATSAQKPSWSPRITQWPVQLTLGATLPLGARTQKPALDRAKAGDEQAFELMADVSPIRGLAIGGDVLVDSTKSHLASAGGQGCSDYTLMATGVRCAPFTQDVIYVTNTYLLMLWAKPYVTLGPVRAWAGAGFGYANVDYLYTKDAAFTDAAWGHGTATRLNASAGFGFDYAYRLSPNGACFIMGASLEAGASRYGESIDNLFYANAKWRNNDVAYVVNPLRAQFSIGFSFPTSHPPGS